MNKQKHQQNQEETLDVTVNKANSDTLQTESQPDATKPQEHGRSMTEMLGVLAIIGVLSIGGIQGYRYAMNKYHSNEVVNELNLLNAQLAIFMNGNHEDEAVMSLGDPYDTTETTKTGGYVFAYGCGQDPTSTTPCDLNETGYYMTLSGVSKDVCKSVSQMTANMMNLVEQRVNNMTDYDGVLCHDNNNVMTFLFDANEGGAFDNGNGEDTNPYNPENTYPYGEETTNVYPEETYSQGEETTSFYPEETSPVETVVTDVNCPAGYFNMNGSCHSCDQHEPYTGVDSYLEELKNCTNRTLTCGTTCSMFCDSYLNMCPDGYMLKSNTTSCSSSGFLAIDTTKDGFSDGILCSGNANACCEPVTCKTNDDCNSTFGTGYYCNVDKSGGTGCISGYGKCRKAQDDIITPQKETPYVLGKPTNATGMSWWAADNFCKALGKNMPPLSEYNCPNWECPNNTCTFNSSFCTNKTSAWTGPKDPSEFSDTLLSILEAYGDDEGYGFWVSTGPYDCNKYAIEPGYVQAFLNPSMLNMNLPIYAICK